MPKSTAAIQWDKLLTAPFSPGRGRTGGAGANIEWLDDERWKAAFPNCKFNKNLGSPSKDDGLIEATKERMKCQF